MLNKRMFPFPACAPTLPALGKLLAVWQVLLMPLCLCKATCSLLHGLDAPAACVSPWCLDESSEGSSGDSADDSDSEHGDGTDGEDEGASEEEDLEDRSGETAGVHAGFCVSSCHGGDCLL